ncbi:unnamed protein product [Rotaria sordida]|uniref:Uncharacterized protein n=1 Tax=Rotaria sordida TaxID=392033 RepID=A0A815IU97_9BILA|nr:unnamed protein product [Rotaria sordida]CAF1370397.1 unnamed protein product [Rotaria sordida]
MIPGIVAFSAHYFWFLLQIGCHCFTKTLRNIKSDHRTNALLFFIDNEIHCFHVNVKQLCRLYVTLSSLAYIGFYASKDLLNCLIVPSGQVPLTLMWGLHLFHLLGLALHVGLTVCSNWTKTSEAMKVWAPPSSEDLQTQDADEPPLANEDTGDRTIAEHDPTPLYINDFKPVYFANLCSLCFKGPLDRYYDSHIMIRLTHHDRMAACNWQFEEFTIEDMILLAALAYQPTEELQTEIDHFYLSKANRSRMMRIDTKHSQFQSHGYGNVTYFTLVTPHTIIVSIRGTKLLYECQRQSEKTVQEPVLYTTNHTKTEKNSSIIPRQTLIHSCRPLTRWWSSEASWCSNAK